MLPEKLAQEKQVTAKSLPEISVLLEKDFYTAYAKTTLADIEFFADGTVKFGSCCLPYVPLFLESLACKIGMPLAYAYAIDFSLFKENFERRKRERSSGVQIAVHRDTAINVCLGEYYPAKTLDVIQSLPKNVMKLNFYEAILGDRGIELSWVDDQICLHPRPGDTILGGIRLSNSESGFRSLKASLFTLRLTCSNGAVFAEEERVVRWSYDRRVTYASNVEKFCNGLKNLEIPQARLSEQYARVLDQPMTDRQIVNLWRRLRRFLPPPDVDQVLGIAREDRREWFARVRAQRGQHSTELTGLNGYEVHNRITAAAKDHDVITRRHLEEIGGQVVWEFSLN